MTKNRISFLFFPLAMTSVAWADSGYVAHEWGTFTSLEDSTGKTAEGMDHADEELPSFVHGRESALREITNGTMRTLLMPGFSPLPTDTPDPDTTPSWPCHGKDCDFDVMAGSPMTVTQKMETPVIYFYSKTAQPIKVDVDFPGGIITQYYPDASEIAPPLGKVDAIANGHVHWDVQISTEKSLPFPPVASDSIWAPSRQTQANAITASGENEKLIFYRGLGHFDTPFRVTDDGLGSLTLQNSSNERVPQIFLLKVGETSAAVLGLGSLSGHSNATVSRETLDHMSPQPIAEYVNQASAQVAQALEQSGLYPDEALAMVNTWKKSYFQTPGLRVLYVLPREWTDRLLPLSLSPRPKDLVRTLVGRVEIMTSAEELSLLGELRRNFQAGTSQNAVVKRLGRFGEAKFRRALELATQGHEASAFVEAVSGLVQEAAKK